MVNKKLAGIMSILFYFLYFLIGIIITEIAKKCNIIDSNDYLDIGDYLFYGFTMFVWPALSIIILLLFIGFIGNLFGELLSYCYNSIIHKLTRWH